MHYGKLKENIILDKGNKIYLGGVLLQ
jgi:hypothetical protein